ncbi:MAG: hypothetical protein GX095_03600 [Clostridiales bacterium]|jgi:cystathionine beta-lyase family protein involved in aluminum resistance|nr:hypothetical protein [Clostridiales bacterium]HOK81475.1 methionine gamma-lyase family protein [Clostridia bacterium]HOL60775.1 methionine gamma-lyase family protein [Clostridia bacterium]HPO53350.1 methionine gamma-lyase family protein [Clostridia bacterium]
MGISAYQHILTAENECKELFSRIDEIAFENQKKVLDAFRKLKISAMHFNPSTGYGYDDTGRDTLGKLFAEALGAESALVSPSIANGTHALTITLFGLLKSGDRIVFAGGEPYDTLKEVIRGKEIGSLADFGIEADTIELKDGKIDYEALGVYLSANKPKVAFITRSRGYRWRDALSLDEIAFSVKAIKSASPSTIVMVDNCYGEFTDVHEPTYYGADIIVGSLIKNPGGGLAPTGGYIAGKAELINKIAGRLTAPSLGAEVGSYFASYLPFYQGLFLAPTVVASALKGNVLAGKVFANLGYEVCPAPDQMPKDIIRSIKFNTKEELISFCQSIQHASPVDSHVTPFPWDMPGYTHQVIMAAGSFIQGSSIELSADSPIKEPYIAYLQGGLTYQHCKLAIAEAAEKILQKP